jgi:site-specific DNA-adenine methylase
VSNSDTEFVRDLFQGFEMIPVINRREINLNSQSRSINELLILNYEKPKGQMLLFPDDESQ